MKNIAIFNLVAAKGTIYSGEGVDGTSHQETAVLGDVGYLMGGAATMRALVLPGYTDSDNWQLVNITDRQYLYLGTVAILGATSEEHAIDAALRTFNISFGNVGQGYDVISAPAFVLSRFLDHEGRAHYKGRVTHEEIRNIYNQVTLKPVVWKNDESTSLTSHSSSGALLWDMQRTDEVRALYDSVTVDEICQELYEGSEMGQYDAIISQVSRMDGLSNRILLAMQKAADKVKPVNVTKTDPFKKNGVVNIAQIYEMEDGQTVTIVYHNPDSTPAKLEPKDMVTSWKFLLNKRDVTAVLQPKSGKDVQIPTLAKRMMLVVEANSPRFKRNQERQLKAENTLLELQKIEQEKKEELNKLDQEIEELQRQLDVPIEQHLTKPVTPKAKSSKQSDSQVQSDADWSRTVNVMLRDAAENGRPKFTRNIDGLIALSKSLIEQNKTQGHIVIDELQYIINQVRSMRQYCVVMPRNDRVTKGKPQNKLRRLNAAFKEAQVPFSMKYFKDDGSVHISSEDSNFHHISFHFLKSEGKWTTPYKMGEYGPLLPAIEAYLNEDPTIERQQIQFGTNPHIIDSSSNQLAVELKNFLLEGVDQAKKDQAAYAEKRKYGLDPNHARAAVELAKTLDPALSAADEASTISSEITSTPEQDIQTPGITPEEMTRLSADLKRLNEDPEWGGNDRYSYFFKRLQRAVDGTDIEAVKWAKNWIAELDQAKADKEVENKQEADRVKENLENADKNLRYQLWENAQALGETDPYTAWISLRSAEFTQQQPKYTNLLGGTQAQAAEYQTAFDEFLNTYMETYKTNQEVNNVTEKDQGSFVNPDELWLDQIINGELDLAGLDMDQFSDVAVKYAELPESPIYAKLEQALNAVTTAKVAKAQGV